MTAAAIHAEAAALRRGGWGHLLWLAPLVAGWFALNYWLPALQASGAQTAASRVSIHVLIALGLWLGLERTELTASQRRDTWLAVMIPFTLWLAVVWSAAINGTLRPGSFPPPVPVAVLLPVIVGLPLLLYSRRLGTVLDAMPASWLVALQVYRVFGMAFLLAWLGGSAPAVFALPAGIGDVITGLLALPVAVSLASGSDDGRRAAIAWNIFGLLDFAVALGIGFSIAFGLIVPGVPNRATGVYPTVLIPAFAVPSSILLHALSLRQLSRRRQSAAARLAGAPTPVGLRDAAQ
jgi:hypothetical protein